MRGRARGRRLLASLLLEAESARSAAGASQADLGRPLGLSASQVGRLLRGELSDVGIVRLSELLSLLGHDLAARAYPVGPPVRDRSQLALLGRLRRRLHPGLRWRSEVPVIEAASSGGIDLRAWDAAIDATAWTLRVDAETRIRDVKEVLRRVSLKQRDSGVASVILLVSDTQANRAAIRLTTDLLSAQFPIPARRALRRLVAGEALGGNALIVL